MGLGASSAGADLRGSLIGAGSKFNSGVVASAAAALAFFFTGFVARGARGRRFTAFLVVPSFSAEVSSLE
jgi:hypothetical protein